MRGLQDLAMVPYKSKICCVGGPDARNPTLETEADQSDGMRSPIHNDS